MSKRVKRTKPKRGPGGQPKLSSAQVRAIVAKVKRGRTYEDVGREYGVHGTAVKYRCAKAGVASRRAIG